MFEPFHISCTVCHSRLLVKSPSLLGKSVACPKCQSVLTIENPAQVKFSPPAGPADSHAITKVAELDWERELQSAIEASREVQESAPAENQRFRDGEAFDDEFRLAPISETPEISHHQLSELRAAEQEHPLPPPDWTEGGSAHTRQWLLISILGIAGILVSGSLFYLFVRYSKQTVQVPEGQQEASDTNPSLQTQDKDPQEEGIAGDRASPETDVNKHDSPEQSNQVEQPGEPDNAELSRKNPEAPSSEQEAHPIDLQAPPKNGNSLSKNGEDGPQPSEGSPVTPSPMGANGEVKKTDDRSPEGLTLPKIFEQFSRPQDSSPFGDARATLEVAEPEVPEKIDFDEVHHPDPAPPPDIPKSLSVEIAGAEWSPQPLTDFLASFSLLTNIGIDIDFESLSAAGVSPLVEVTCKGEETNFQQLLDQALDSVGLKARTEPTGTLLIMATEDQIVAHLPSDWSLADLVGSGDALPWQDLIQKITPELTQSFEWKGSEILWQPTAKPIEKYRVAMLFDRIRAAAGLRPKGSYLAEDLQTGWEPYRQMAAKLKHQATSVQPVVRPILQVITSAARELDLRIVVQWKHAWSHGLTPTLDNLTLFRNRTLSQILRSTREKYALDLIVVDADNLFLVAPEYRRQWQTIRVVPFPEGSDLEKLKEHLRMVSPTDSDRISQLAVEVVPGHSLAIIRIAMPTIELLDALLTLPN